MRLKSLALRCTTLLLYRNGTRIHVVDGYRLVVGRFPFYFPQVHKGCRPASSREPFLEKSSSKSWPVQCRRSNDPTSKLVATPSSDSKRHLRLNQNRTCGLAFTLQYRRSTIFQRDLSPAILFPLLLIIRLMPPTLLYSSRHGLHRAVSCRVRLRASS